MVRREARRRTDRGITFSSSRAAGEAAIRAPIVEDREKTGDFLHRVFARLYSAPLT
jgi:hypothetical protein